MLMRMYLRWCEREGFKAEVVDLLPGEEAGIKSVTIEVTGEYAYGYLRGEIGVHRLIRISPFDSSSRRQTSFASVSAVPEVDDVEVNIREDELRVDVFRSSGPGGQGVNTADSAVRITHLPTNIVVSCQNERSQLRNRDTAMRILKARLFEIAEKKQKDELSPADRDQEGDRVRQPDPHLHLPPRAADQGPPHRHRDRQRRGRDGRRDRRVHQGLSPVGAEPAGVSEPNEVSELLKPAPRQARGAASAWDRSLRRPLSRDPLGRAVARAAGPGDRGGAEGGRAREHGRPRGGAPPSRQDLLRPPHGSDRADPALRAGRSAGRRIHALHRAGHRRLRRGSPGR